MDQHFTNSKCYTATRWCVDLRILMDTKSALLPTMVFYFQNRLKKARILLNYVLNAISPLFFYKTSLDLWLAKKWKKKALLKMARKWSWPLQIQKCLK